MQKTKTVRLATVLLLASTIVVPGPAAVSATDHGGGVPGDPLRVTPDSEVGGSVHVITPDGASLVYFEGGFGSKTLMQRPLLGGDPIILAGPTAGNLAQSLFVPTGGSHVVFVADLETAGTLEIFSVPIGGGQVEKLNDPLVAGGNVHAFSVEFSGDGSHVVYVADADSDNDLELFAAPVGGGAATKLHANFQDGGGVSLFKVAPSGDRVVYVAKTAQNNKIRLFETPIENWSTTRISPQAAKTVDRFEFTNDGTKVIWDGKLDFNNRQELFVVPIDGGDSTKISGPMVAQGSTFRFKPTGDDAHVVYTADQDTDGVVELYAAASDGSSWRKLNNALPANADVRNFDVSTHDDSVLFTADQETQGQVNAYLVKASSGTPTQLNPALTGSWSHFPTFTPDGLMAVFTAETGPMGAERVYSVNPANNQVKWISQGIEFEQVIGDALQFVVPIWITGDSSRVIYAAEPVGGDPGRLFVSRLNAATALDLTGPTTSTIYQYRPQTMGAFASEVAPHGTHVTYWSDGAIYTVTDRNYKCGGKTATHVGTDGNDTMSGTAGPDIMVGLNGHDVINGLGANDTLCGRAGGDTLKGGSGADLLVGEKGNDTLNGNNGNDTLKGSQGKDTLMGAGGNDLLQGGGGVDSLFGGPGDDDMRGGPQPDTCDGGDGIDTAVSCQPSNVP